MNIQELVKFTKDKGYFVNARTGDGSEVYMGKMFDGFDGEPRLVHLTLRQKDTQDHATWQFSVNLFKGSFTAYSLDFSSYGLEKEDRQRVFNRSERRAMLLSDSSFGDD